MKNLKKLIAVFIILFITTVSIIAFGNNRYYSKSGISYLKKMYPKAARIEFITDGHNTSYFVVVDSNYNVHSFVSYNEIGRSKMEEVVK